MRLPDSGRFRRPSNRTPGKPWPRSPWKILEIQLIHVPRLQMARQASSKYNALHNDRQVCDTLQKSTPSRCLKISTKSSRETEHRVIVYIFFTHPCCGNLGLDVQRNSSFSFAEQVFTCTGQCWCVWHHVMLVGREAWAPVISRADEASSIPPAERVLLLARCHRQGEGRRKVMTRDRLSGELVNCSSKICMLWLECGKVGGPVVSFSCSCVVSSVAFSLSVVQMISYIYRALLCVAECVHDVA